MVDFQKAPLIERLSIKLSDAQKNDLLRWINSGKSKMASDREAWFERQDKYLSNYDDFITYVRKGPWDDAANLHLPFTALMVKSYHARLYNMFSQEDITQIVGREGTDEETAAMFRNLYRWYFYDYINGKRGAMGVLDEICMDIPTVGFAVVMKSWELVQRKVLDLEVNELKKEMKDLAPQMQEAAEQGTKVDVSPYKEVEKIITKYEGTRLVSVPYENIYFPAFIPETSDLNYPPLVIVTANMTFSELNLKAAQGLFDKDAVEKVIASGKSVDVADSQAQRARDKKAELSGVETEDYLAACHEAGVQYNFASYDVDDDGINEELVITTDAAGTQILAVTHLDRISRSGSRPLYKFDCFAKPRQGYSRGIVEYLYPLQTELDMNHNMKANYLQLQTCPFGVYRASSSLKNEEIRIAPGKFIPVDDTSDLKPLYFNANATVLQGEESILWSYGQQLANVSSLSHGVVPQSVGPLRSTSGMMGVLGEMEKEFRPVANRIALAFKAMVEAVIEDLDIRVDPSLKLRILGGESKRIEDMAAMMDPKGDNRKLATYQALQFARHCDLKIDVASFINSEEMRRNNAYQVFTALLNPSLLQQMGIVTPRNLYNAANKWIRTFSYMNPDDFVTEPQDNAPVLTLAQEVQFILQGVVPPMSMMDDHAAKANGLTAFAAAPEYNEAKLAGLAVASVDNVMARTIKKHQEMGSALQPKGLPNFTGANGMDMNAMLAGRGETQGGMSERTTNRVTAADQPAPVLDQGGFGESQEPVQ